MTNKTLSHRILVVDDDKEIVRLVRSYLEQAGYNVLTAHDGNTALQSIRSDRPDLVVLDLMLPERDGLEITRVVRGDDALAGIPIIMLTARVEDIDKILGLELGADDYITKPFNPREVVARVRTVLRRSGSENGTSQARVLQIGEVLMDLGRHEVIVEGKPVELTQTEFKLLQHMMENPGYAFTRAELIQNGLGYEYEGIERTLDSHIKNLRKKIEPDVKQPLYIQTVYGVGYRFG
ncbi:response regulator transcription factor [Chloroflexi bacterium TSY]|nr:response regulator transcription factor [Chloroflexi bacterium TSY]